MAGRLAKLVFIGGILVWILNASVRWNSAGPLGHDESRYSVDTRDIASGKGKRYLYVPLGMNAIAAPGIVLGGGERALRTLPLVAGLGFLLAAWILARRLTSPETAYWVVGVLAGAHPMAKYSADLLSDIPSAACLLAALAILLPALTGPEPPGKKILLAAPLCAAAFYIRYGSTATIGIIGIVSVLAGARAVLRRPVLPLATGLAFGALLVPYAIYSHMTTGSITGILVMSAEVPGHGGGEGLVKYVAGNGFAFYGILIAPLMLAALTLGLRRDRTTLAMQAIAVGQIVVLGMTTHAQARFVFLATVLLVIVGVDALRRRGATLAPRLRDGLAIVAALAIATTWVTTTYAGLRSSARVANAAATVIAGVAIHADVKGLPCDVVGKHSAQLEWYAGCVSANAAVIVPSNLIPGSRIYAVREREPGQPDLEALPGVHCPVATPGSVVEVIRLQAPATVCDASGH